MSKLLIIAWREFSQTVFRKVFLLAVIGIPLAIGVAITFVIVVVAKHEQPPLIGTIAIVESTGELAEAARAEFDPEQIARNYQRQLEDLRQAGRDALTGGVSGIGPTQTRRIGIGKGEVRVIIEQHDEASEELLVQLKKRMGQGQLIAAAVVAKEVITAPDPDLKGNKHPKYQLFIANEVDKDHTGFIEDLIGQAIVRVRAARADLDPDEALAMLRRPTSMTKRLLPNGQETDESAGARELAQMIPMVFMILVWGSVFTSAQHLMMTTIEEKSNRVMEILLSAVSPFQLMTGKILGMGGVGLMIVLIYTGFGLGSLVAFAAGHLVSVMDIAYLFIFFFMAYFMIAAIMAAVGSAVSDIREANTLVTPVMMVVMIPLILWFPISNDPNGGIATAFSFIPPAIPFVMILRLAADEGVKHAWQIPVTIAWGYACVLGMIWLAAKIFRVGVLMYGKPPSPLQLLKWLRYS